MGSSEVPTREEFRAWLIGRVAFHLDMPEDEIDPSAELARYGVDSVYALSIASDIEDRLEFDGDLGAAKTTTTVDALVDLALDKVER